MLRNVGLICAICTVLTVPGVLAQQPAEGLWLTEPMKKGGFAHIRISPSDGRVEWLCGKIVDIFKSDREDLLGASIIQDMVRDGDASWTDGKIWSPDKNQLYDSNMMLAGEGLEVRGCLAGLCKVQLWVRVQ